MYPNPYIQQDNRVPNDHALGSEPMELLQISDDNDWYDLFRMFDEDNDGFIPLKQINGIMRHYGARFGLNVKETENLLRGIDRNGDKLIDFPEFAILMYRAKKVHLRRYMLQTARSVLPRRQQVEATRYLLEYTFWPPPLFIVLVSVLQLAFYIYHQFEFCGGEKFQAAHCSPTRSALILNPCKKLDIWRYISYMFVHVGYVHLLTNIFVQLALGFPLELVHKWRIAMIYIAGVITGALLFFVFDREVFLAGASGGGYTLLSAHIANVILNWGEMEFHWIRTLILLVLVGTDIGTSIYQRYFAPTPSKISYIAHIGGFVAGLFLGVVILRNLKKLRWERYAWWISLIVFSIFILMCIAFIGVQEWLYPSPAICKIMSNTALIGPI